MPAHLNLDKAIDLDADEDGCTLKIAIEKYYDLSTGKE